MRLAVLTWFSLCSSIPPWKCWQYIYYVRCFSQFLPYSCQFIHKLSYSSVCSLTYVVETASWKNIAFCLAEVFLLLVCVCRNLEYFTYSTLECWTRFIQPLTIQCCQCIILNDRVKFQAATQVWRWYTASAAGLFPFPKASNNLRCLQAALKVRRISCQEAWQCRQHHHLTDEKCHAGIWLPLLLLLLLWQKCPMLSIEVCHVN